MPCETFQTLQTNHGVEHVSDAHQPLTSCCERLPIIKKHLNVCGHPPRSNGVV